MKRVILTKGLPGCGKTTWAKDLQRKNPGQWKRINKDDLRAMLDDSKHSKHNENFVLKTRDFLIQAALNDGKNVVIDDTNLHPTHEARIKELVKGKATVEIMDMTDVPLQTCIKRDLQRLKSVGKDVIMRMYNEYLKPPVVKVEQNHNLEHAIIVDIDGTLAIKGDRSPYDWSRVGEDTLNEEVANLVRILSEEYAIVIMSGRDSICWEETVAWLNEHDIEFDLLCMREEGSTEKDSIVKREMFESKVKNEFYIRFVLDDRDSVVAMWREMGLPCFQVNYGDF